MQHLNLTGKARNVKFLLHKGNMLFLKEDRRSFHKQYPWRLVENAGLYIPAASYNSFESQQPRYKGKPHYIRVFCFLERKYIYSPFPQDSHQEKLNPTRLSPFYWKVTFLHFLSYHGLQNRDSRLVLCNLLFCQQRTSLIH